MTDQTRRKPKQARSLQRYEHILDTAEALILENGYDAMTTNAIAERADVSIGSLYQYFPNKDAILLALSERYVEQRRALSANMADEHAIKTLPLPELVEFLIEPIIAFYEQHPALTYIYLGTDISPDMAAAYAELDRESVAFIGMVIDLRAPHVPGDRREWIAVSIKAMIKALLALLMNAPDRNYRVNVSAEVKRMLLAYFRDVAQEEDA